MKWPGNAHNQPTTFGKLNRFELMSRVRGSGNRTTELKMAQLLRKAKLKGWRRHLPLLGKPDFAWPLEHVALFVDGCFWHGHNCRNLSPRTNVTSWRNKIEKNRKRDKKVTRDLRAQGWSVLRVWECQLKSSTSKITSRIELTLSRSRDMQQQN